jgi:hypothetical protein
MYISNVTHNDFSLIAALLLVRGQIPENFFQIPAFGLQRNDIKVMLQSHLHELFVKCFRIGGAKEPGIGVFFIGCGHGRKAGKPFGFE